MKKWIRLLVIFLLVLAGVWGLNFYSSDLKIGSLDLSSQENLDTAENFDFYTKYVHPIIDTKCIACHTCTISPCQLNLSNIDGIRRGMTAQGVHKGIELSESPLTRLGIDKPHGFWSVLGEKNAMLLESVLQRQRQPLPTSIKAEASEQCPQGQEALLSLYKKQPELGMPYGLPPLNSTEIKIIDTWLTMGAPGPNATQYYKSSHIPAHGIPVVRKWESLLNQTDLKSKIAARYIYEHLFSGQIFFPETPGIFYRLIRSSRSCDQFIEIPTRRPFNDPGSYFQYCFRRFDTAIMDKNHNVYVLDENKKERWLDLFWRTAWEPKKLPAYSEETSSNPFLTFQDIPVLSRYQFLLDDAHYHVATFIKGSVCVGNYAVNSINEQFFVFFLDPENDLSVHDQNYYQKIIPYMRLPAQRGSDPLVLNLLHNRDLAARNQYRKIRAKAYEKKYPKGPDIHHIWDGDGYNNNAILTVFRHGDSAHVLKGLKGDLSKTVFILDYPLFERLVYNLVVGYDVYGNITHGLFTRFYMSFIRMEAEELFLSFLPIAARQKLRDEWYKGWIFGTQAKMALKYPLEGLNTPTQIEFHSSNYKLEFIDKLLNVAIPEKAQGSFDFINWKHKYPWAVDIKKWQQDFPEHALWQSIVSVPFKEASFVQFFPDISFVRVQKEDLQDSSVYSLVRNKEYENLAWVMNEGQRRDRPEDRLYVLENFAGSYPNMFFDVPPGQLSEFVNRIKSLKTENDYQEFLKKYGVLKNSNNFWSFYQWMNQKSLSLDPIYNGRWDLIRYGNRENE